MLTVLTSADNGKTVDLRVGDEATLRLPENPSTGYRWAVDTTDPNLIDLRQGNYVSSSNATGGGGEVEWLIKAKAAGAAEVKFKRWRPWEGDSSVVERYAITLRISP